MKKVTILVSDQTHSRLKKLARDKNTSMGKLGGEFVRSALSDIEISRNVSNDILGPQRDEIYYERKHHSFALNPRNPDHCQHCGRHRTAMVHRTVG